MSTSTRIAFEVQEIDGDAVETLVYTGAGAEIAYAGNLILHRADWARLLSAILTGVPKETKTSISPEGTIRVEWVTEAAPLRVEGPSKFRRSESH